MIKISAGQRKKYKENTSQIRLNKKINNNMQINPPRLSHQENNYFYNTKINRLILQEAPNNSIQNIYQQPSQINNDISFRYDLLQGKVNNLFNQNKSSENFYHKNSNYQNLAIDMMNNNQNNYYSKDMDEITYINVNNNFNNNNFCNNKTENAIISKSLRLTENNTKLQEIKKIHIKQNPVNNYDIKNKNTLAFSHDNDYYQTKGSYIKNNFKSKKINLNQNKENNIFKVIYYKSGSEFYKKTDDKNTNIKNKTNNSKEKNIIDDKKNNKRNSQDKNVNQAGYVYFKNNSLNNKSIEIIKRNNQNKGNKIQDKNRTLKTYDNNLLDKKLEKFCEIIEEIFFIFFKSSYNYFIHNLNLFIKNRNLSKTLILKRFDEVNRQKKIKENNSNIDINITNYNKDKNLLYNNIYQKNYAENTLNEINKSNSSKLNDLQNNLVKSMMKINNDQYIKMFSNLLQNNHYDLKKSNSPSNDRLDTKINDNVLKNSYNNIFDEDKNNNKYNTSTDTNNIFQSKNNKNVNLKNNRKIHHNQSCEIITNKNIYFNNRLTIGKQTAQNNDIIRKNPCLKDDEYFQNLKSDINLSERKNKNDKNITNKRMSLLYSKPMHKKSTETHLIKEKKGNKIQIENKKRSNLYLNIYSKNNRSLNFLKNEFDESNYDEFKEIIVKNVKTKDKRLYVFIKYIPFIYDIKWRIDNRFINENLLINHTDSIKIINNNTKNDILQSKIDKYCNLKHNKIHLNQHKKDSEKKDVFSIKNVKGEQSMNKKFYNNYIVINDNIKNALKYLISLLSNIYNDNIKQVLYLFFKNLRKIKRISLFSSMRIGNTNCNIRLFKNSNKNYLKENFLLTESYNTTRNKTDENMNNLIYNNSQDLSLKTNIINRNYDNNDNILANKNKNSLDEDKDKKFDNIIEMNKQNKKLGENNREKIEKKKLAKLGKLFNNLNKENNIINTIKEQFLDWANNNEIQIKSKSNMNNKNKENQKQEKEYNVKTFDKKYLINKDINNFEKDFEDKLNIFKNKLISFGLNGNKEISN